MGTLELQTWKMPGIDTGVARVVESPLEAT
jgi:hypothetical protein